MEDSIHIETAKNGRISQITVGDLLFGGVLLVAVVLRFFELGGQLLTPAEAEMAWSAWAFWQPDSVMLAEGSPLYHSLTRLLAPVLGFSDLTVRLVPALFGVGVVLLPWLWRDELGTMGALVSSLLLAVSPLQTAVSRTVGGDTTAIFAILLLGLALFRYRQNGQNGWLYTAAVGLALGLTSTPLFYTAIITFGIAAFVYDKIGLPLFEEERAELTWEVRRTAVIIAVAVFAAISTLFLWYPAGIGGAALLPATWAQQFGFANSSQIVEPFLILLRYEPGLVLLGLLAMGWVTFRNHPVGAFLIYWFAAAALFALLQPTSPANAVLLTVPAALLVGLFADVQLNGRWDELSFISIASGVVLLMLVFVNLTRFLRVATFQPDDITNLLIIMLAVLLAASGIFLLASWDVDYVPQASVAALIIVIVFYSWGTAWWLSGEGKHDPRERWVSSATDDDARFLFPLIDELSEQATNSTTDLEIRSSVDTPLLRWYLRDYETVRYVESVPADATDELIITPATTELELSFDYLGSDYGLLRPEVVLVTTETAVTDTLKWWLFQESATPINEERVIVWLRADLAQ